MRLPSSSTLAPTPVLPSLTVSPLVLAAFAGVASTSLHAQTASEGPASRQLEAVTISAPVEHGEKYAPARTSTAIKGDAPLRDVPQSVQVITEEVMRDQGVRSMQDALKNTPSIGLMAGDGQRDAFVIRGFNALFDILLDGVRDRGPRCLLSARA